jgi:hypothetical protein
MIVCLPRVPEACLPLRNILLIISTKYIDGHGTCAARMAYLEQTKRLDGILLIKRKAVVNSGGENQQIAW